MFQSAKELHANLDPWPNGLHVMCTVARQEDLDTVLAGFEDHQDVAWVYERCREAGLDPAEPPTGYGPSLVRPTIPEAPPMSPVRRTLALCRLVWFVLCHLRGASGVAGGTGYTDAAGPEGLPTGGRGGTRGRPGLLRLLPGGNRRRVVRAVHQGQAVDNAGHALVALDYASRFQRWWRRAGALLAVAGIATLVTGGLTETWVVVAVGTCMLALSWSPLRLALRARRSIAPNRAVTNRRR